MATFLVAFELDARDTGEATDRAEEMARVFKVPVTMLKRITDTHDDIEAAMSFLPDAQTGRDNEGQFVIYTGVYEGDE